jgi:hypothetical protein
MSTDFNSENTFLNNDLIRTIGISMQLEISNHRLISFWNEIDQKNNIAVESCLRCMGAWQGVAMDSLKVSLEPAMPDPITPWPVVTHLWKAP